MKKAYSNTLKIVAVVVSLIGGWFLSRGFKNQWIRIVEILVFGPIVIYAGTQVEQEWLGVILMILGAGTMTYNLRNFIRKWNMEMENY